MSQNSACLRDQNASFSQSANPAEYAWPYRFVELGEHLFEFAEEQRLQIGKGRDELLGELLAGQCDDVLVDIDGRPHRLVQVVPLVVRAYEVVKCRKRIALPESLKDG